MTIKERAIEVMPGVPSCFPQPPSNGLPGAKHSLADGSLAGTLVLCLLALLASSVRGEPEIPHRSAYYKDGEIHVNVLGSEEGQPVTSGYWDFKPSWSQTGDLLVFFRRLKNDPDVVKWKTAICTVKVDGSGFHQLTDGTHTDFNQTWTRDGTNTPIWNRRNPRTGVFRVMASRVGAKPGEEYALTGKDYHSWAYTTLKDGRIFVGSNPPGQRRGYFLMKPNRKGEPLFERVSCDLAEAGTLDRVSVSPSEKKICLLYTSPSPRDRTRSRMPSSA